MKGRISVLVLIPVFAGVWWLTGMLKHHHASLVPVTAAVPGVSSGTVTTAIAYARKQIGCPYVYGGTGPCSSGFDCSGLVQQAYGAAGVGIPRTSEDQWAQLRHVSTPETGDLVFFTGSSIDPPPGHVGMIVDPVRHLMLDAYGAGTYVREETYGESSSAQGLSIVTGYAEP